MTPARHQTQSQQYLCSITLHTETQSPLNTCNNTDTSKFTTPFTYLEEGQIAPSKRKTLTSPK